MSTQDLILVTGATGKIGASIGRQLDRFGKEIRLLVRDPKKLSGFLSAEKVIGDYGDVESLNHAFRGVSSAFIVSGYAEPGERSDGAQPWNGAPLLVPYKLTMPLCLN